MNNTLRLKRFGERITLRTVLFVSIVISYLGFLYVAYLASFLVTSTSRAAWAYFLMNFIFVSAAAAVWSLAALAGLRLRQYAQWVIASPDGQALNAIATGLLLLVPYSVVVTVDSTVKLLFMHTAYSKLASVVIQSLAIVILLVAATYIYRGSRQLVTLLPAMFRSMRQARILALVLFVLLAAGFVWYFYQVTPSAIDDDGLPHYALSRGILLVTYILPYIVAWLLGLLACLHIAHYAHHVEGILYKPLFYGLHLGLMIVFGCTLLAQLLRTTSITLASANAGFLLVLGVIALLMYGYLRIYRGAEGLSRLEEWR